MQTQNQEAIYLQLFQGRQDVFAKRWEKAETSGYMPAYDVDWEAYRKHKAQGGSFKNFKLKTYTPFTKEAIRSHWGGKEMLGVYPLLEDGTSSFIAADFDKKNWKEQVQLFYEACHSLEIPVYVEISRSGNGGHVWVFFEQAYLAKRSRRIVFEILRKAKVISEFDKDGSFDRLFPNQDALTNLGIGNLIALPLNGKYVLDGKTCFVDVNDFAPFENQWKYLESIERVSIEHLDKVYEQFFGEDKEEVDRIITREKSNILEIVIKNQVYLKKIQLSEKLKLFIREHLNFANSDYFVRKRIGRSTYKTEPFFKLIEESDDEVLLPKGFVAQLVVFCRQEEIEHKIIDIRVLKEDIIFSSNIELFDYQKEILEVTEKKDFGVIVAPPGTGKTIISLEIIHTKKQPALIIVHRKQLFDQWIDRIQSFLGIPKHEIGQITTGKKSVGKQITVAMMQSLKKLCKTPEINSAFGIIIIDECHHIPAKTFRETIIHFSSFYLYGVTATPKRKNNDEKLIFVYIGNIIARIRLEDLKHKNRQVALQIKETTLSVPFNYKTDEYEVLSNILIYDTTRNQMIIDDLQYYIKEQKSILVLSERKAHLKVLNLYLKETVETIVVSGEDSERSRKSKLEQIKMGHFQVVLSTGQFFGEGLDIPNFNCLSLVYPFAFEGKLIQYIGRVQRSEHPPIIIDYRDPKVDYFEKLFKKRNTYYNKLRKRQLLI